jgi:hypothetical protein
MQFPRGRYFDTALSLRRHIKVEPTRRRRRDDSAQARRASKSLLAGWLGAIGVSAPIAIFRCGVARPPDIRRVQQRFEIKTPT